jgi:ASC-1-like (ASCH) protein
MLLFSSIVHYVLSGRMNGLPLFMAKREVFAWLKAGAKTIDVRKGPAWKGDVAVFQCGNHYLELPIVKKETGKLTDVIRQDNYLLVIPTAKSLEEALYYLQRIYGVENGVFTAYHLAQKKQ